MPIFLIAGVMIVVVFLSSGKEERQLMTWRDYVGGVLLAISAVAIIYGLSLVPGILHV